MTCAGCHLGILSRLIRIRGNNIATDIVSEFRYDALNHLAMWRHPKRTGINNGVAREGLTARWHSGVYDDRWRLVEVNRNEREAGDIGSARASTTDINLYERRLWHNAEADGRDG